ncbi:ParB N-terminal domain-containing protein [Anaerococcus sp. Marseille-Q5996]|uniref:ParB N-terminal domain-containing protein n=1 Tax=Anaerococcus sp. Marseille-Q5996 TaxID=2972769 RepID=UPI0021C76694|nr:ParB N-terminal domain-containing protein [Anaerococcus sp. Marseille-Q5996]
MDNKLNIVYKSIDELIPYINNPRNNENAIDAVASSIKNFGFKQPIVIDSKNEVVAGHTRLLASKKLGLEEVPLIIASELIDAKIRAFI